MSSDGNSPENRAALSPGEADTQVPSTRASDMARAMVGMTEEAGAFSAGLGEAEEGEAGTQWESMLFRLLCVAAPRAAASRA